MGGLVAYLWIASDSIMQEMQEKRPQVTIKVAPKRTTTQRAEAPAAESPKPAVTQTESTTATDVPTAAAARPPAPPPSVAAPAKETTAQSPTEDKSAQSAAVSDQATRSDPEQADGAAGQPVATQGADASLHPHPDPKLVEETDLGPLPKIDEAGRQPWRVYGRPFNVLDQRARIAVVITQLGLSPKVTQEAVVDLPAAVTLGFAPYAKGLGDWIRRARDNGHEVLIGLPMEPQDYPRNDPGPFGLMISNSTEENTKRLNWALSRVTGYVGVFNFMGSRFSVDKAAVKPVLEQLKGRGLLVLDTRATPFSIMSSVAKEIGLPYAVMDISPDAEPNRGYIDRQLGELEEAAISKKAVVAVVQPYPITMLRLKRWIEQLGAKQVVLAPLSAVVQRPTAAH